MAVYLPVRSISRSQNVRIGTQKLVKGTTTYVDISNTKVRRDLERHSAIGAILVVGPITGVNVDSVVLTGGIVTGHSGALSVDVSAGELRTRSTGVIVAGAAGTQALTAAPSATHERTDLIWWDSATGAIGKTDGTVALTGASVAPATPAGKTPLATVLVPTGAADASTDVTIVDKRPRQ